MIKLKFSHQSIIKIKKLNYAVTNSVLSLTTKNQVELKINEIPNNSNILIGGYLTYGIPNNLISILSNSKCNNLTLITNASIISNQNLRHLFKIEGKVKRVITSLDNNRSILLDKDLIKSNNSFELNLISCLKFIQNYCNTNNNIDDKDMGQYALVKSDYIDKNFNLFWLNRSYLYFNDSFAKSALFFSISECDNILNENLVDKKHLKIVDSNFVKSVLVINNIDNSNKEDNQQSFSHYFNQMNDLIFDSLLKRVLLEFNQNNHNLYLSNDLKFIIESFYMPKYLTLNILNKLIDMNWPSRQEWISHVKKLDICVCHAKMLNQNGEIKFDNTIKTDCMEMDVINNLNEQTKLVAVIKFNQNKTEISKIKEEKAFTISCSRKPDLIISDLGVFEYNKYESRFELREYYSEDNLNEISKSNFSFPFQPFVNEKSIKIMPRQCF
jgi:hypothetical protein